VTPAELALGYALFTLAVAAAGLVEARRVEKKCRERTGAPAS